MSVPVPLAELLGIEHPVIQAPMAGAQGASMAIAVSDAGGLGSLPCAMSTPESIRVDLEAILAATDKPYNVNFFVHQQPQPDEAAEARWRAAFEPYYDEYGIDPTDIPAGPGRLPFGDAAADVLEDFRPPIVSFHFGLPEPPLVARVRSWGATILASATTVDEGLWLEAHGADVVIAQGLEAGGHRGIFLSDDLTTQVGTVALVPQLVRALKVPVVAAGGIADAAGVRAARALGAAGVQVGTAYLFCPEAMISALHRLALHSDAARHTALTNVFTGRPARGIVNRLIRELGPLTDIAPQFPLAAAAVAPLRAAAEANGSDDFSPLWAGQNAPACREISAAELTRVLID
ncbi:MAG TPA: nitronate monooxygenase [Ilumatobacteraceae bacterium]|jgi:nitronate monooxygenase